MRDDWTAPRGEAGRVAARVRDLLGGAETDSGTDSETASEPDGARLSSRVQRPAFGRQFAAMVPVRLDPGRRGALAVGLAVLLAAVITGIWLMSARPKSVAVSATLPTVPGSAPLEGTAVTGGPSMSSVSAVIGASGAAVSGPAAPGLTPSSVTASAPAGVVVDVAGKVAHPGVYHLPGGSRVDDAVKAAGGAVGRVDLSRLNLAALLVDGQQVSVGVPGSAPAPIAGVEPGTAGSTGDSATVAIVDLNTASLAQLQTLPGVGPVLGQHILDWRTQHGSFTGIDQLQDVSGIGDVKFAALRGLVSV